MPLTTDLVNWLRSARGILNSRATKRVLTIREREVTAPVTGSMKIAGYFADSTLNRYQSRRWFAPLAALAETWPVAIITRAPTTALALLDESPVPVLY